MRFHNINQAINHNPLEIDRECLTDIFNVKVFKCDSKSDNYENIANYIKQWARMKGATHYAHWFQPLRNNSAEKHSTFLDITSKGEPIVNFSAKVLIQQESDASSFPSGGLRNTFEARGYTAVDLSSPVFIIENVLYIPTIFVSYNGEALDYKTPLLRCLKLIDKAATNTCKYLNNDVTKVDVTLGIEQEYFLVDKNLFYSRSDLILTGRTLLGHSPAKSYQFEDHYFKSISPRVMNFMKEVEIKAAELGIPIQTRHNEVAPNQFEVACKFENANLAIDHNILLMNLMEMVCDKHNFKVLFHEKPFKGINGSGKHTNWSLKTNTGVNLLYPDHQNILQFLFFFINVIKAVYDNQSLITSAICSSSNDHRLGANEAPPSIISIYIGSYLFEILKKLNTVVKYNLSANNLKHEIIEGIPEILIHNTDRNRTSPIAFTGDKFEIRSVGSNANCSEITTIFNTIVANQLISFNKEIEKIPCDDEMSILKLLDDLVEKAKPILFQGDGYSKEWEKEAQKRVLKSPKNTVESLQNSVKDVKCLIKHEILSKNELKARYQIKLEKYSTDIQIEAQTLFDIVSNQIIPNVIIYYNSLQDNKLEISIKLKSKISNYLLNIDKQLENLNLLCVEAKSINDDELKAVKYSDEIKPIMNEIRKQIDELELITDDKLWPLVKYRELLFIN